MPRPPKNAVDKTDYYQRAPLKFGSDSEFFPDRAMLEHEFDTIHAQQGNAQGLTGDDWALLRRRIFFQRPLKPQARGKCTLYPARDRALKALISSQDFALEQKLSNLKMIFADRSKQDLTRTQRDAIRAHLGCNKKITWHQLRKLKVNKQPLFPDGIIFNLEEGVTPDKALAGNITRADFYKSEPLQALLKRDVEKLDKIVELLIDPPAPEIDQEPDLSQDEGRAKSAIDRS